ncbi:Propanoyl-CoA C-acyltransferase [Sphingobium herbicidovorans NBRC 16415]|uniref:Propanoyl-CoA C-acyltransferase n=1 Tax=Sphingobium herbicidovorans (strain ATCC 700291 / DSM 11019 / CCUG 56400 / KCTC 2939 / LMG 18315 / NBRC 16415 / MH) TaxID=1219045 RepID=A0A086PC12_SPHHM|nr:thiolase family protein [Sphingobium herbicidovorans]KFG90930.1 Propanoyl-CoA C-acyltransferase [Sphingobium herbicidovorans NBRC 16415]
MSDIAVAATFELKPGRYPQYSPATLYSEVVKQALRQWQLHPKDVDGLLTAPSGIAGGNIDVVSHERLIGEFGIQANIAETLSAGGASFGIMVMRAAAAIRDGMASAVLCVGTGQFVKQGAGAGELMARILSEQDFEMPYGPAVPSLYGLIASQFMHERGATSEHLARVAVSARKWALRNPMALMHERGEITVEDVLNSRVIANPFRYLDCSIPTDGGGALLVTRADVARRLSPQPAYVLGYGEAHSPGSLSEAGPRLIDTRAAQTAAEAFRRAGLSHADIDLVQLYDAFSVTPLILLENVGFCAPGEAGAFVESGATDPGGRLPMNTSGGLLSFGHTGEASGMSVLLEGIRQVMGEAGPNQVEKADTSLVHVYGGMMADHATLIFGREP